MDRKILFAAIAQGIVNYLKDNINDSLEIDVSVSQSSSNQITSKNSTVTVTQQLDSSNRVVSTGKATNIELKTE